MTMTPQARRAEKCPECDAPPGTCWSQSGSMGQRPSCYRDPTVGYDTNDWRKLMAQKDAELSRLTALVDLREQENKEVHARLAASEKIRKAEMAAFVKQTAQVEEMRAAAEPIAAVVTAHRARWHALPYKLNVDSDYLEALVLALEARPGVGQKETEK